MNIINNTAWGFITARGGSKSIPLKNVVSVKGKPLIAYCIQAANHAKTLDRIICSTDHDKIASVAEALGAEIMQRPEHLRGDLVSSIDVVMDAVNTLSQARGSVAEIIVLIQPTSIFLTSEHIDAAVNALLDSPKTKSSQTVVKVPHQFHAYNQRIMIDDARDISFAFPEEREIGHNKQVKPVFYTYGNLIVTRTESLMEEKTLFARPSIPIVIPHHYSFDLDVQEDLELAEIMLHHKMVESVVSDISKEFHNHAKARTALL